MNRAVIYGAIALILAVFMVSASAAPLTEQVRLFSKPVFCIPPLL